MISFDDLITPVTKDQAQASIYRVLAILGANTTTWKPGAVMRAFITAVALLFGSLSQLQALVARAGFLELSSGQWLSQVAYYVFGVTRIEATFAAGFVTLTNAGGGIYTLDPDDLILRNSATGKTYRNTESFSLGALGTATFAIEAVEQGSGSTSNPGAIDEIVSGIVGPVSVSNAAAVVGQDEETDPLLRTRCLEKLGSLSPNGPWDAYSYACRNAKRADGSSIGVTRVRTTKDGFGNVHVYAATATGGITGDADDPNTDLGALNEAIQRLAAPLGVTAWMHSAEPVTIAVTYTATMYNNSGLTEQQIKDAIAARLVSFMSTQPIGGNLVAGVGSVYADAIRTVIGASLSQIFTVALAAPAGDTILGIAQVPQLGTVTPTIVQVAPPDGGV